MKFVNFDQWIYNFNSYQTISFFLQKSKRKDNKMKFDVQQNILIEFILKIILFNISNKKYEVNIAIVIEDFLGRAGSKQK